MGFKAEHCSDFEVFTAEIRPTILSFDGCRHMHVWRDINSPNTYFTYSVWDSEEHLNRYRESDFFKKTWAQTKQWFSERPAAWSVEQITE